MIILILKILKIIGIILLILLSIILLLLLIVLLVPITYDVGGNYKDSNGYLVRLKIGWLFGGIKLRASYKDLLRIKLSILGKDIFKKKSKSAYNTKFDTEDIEPYNEELTRKEEIELSTSRLHSEINVEDDTVFRSNVNFDLPETKKLELDEEEKKSFEDKIISLIFKIKEKLSPIYCKFKSKIEYFLYSIDNKIEFIETKIDEFVTEENVKFVKKVFIIVGKLLLHILPKNANIKANIGFDDPTTTGELLAISSLINPKFINLDLQPDFEKEVKNIQGNAHGRIFIGYIVFQVLRIVCDIRFWKNIKKIKQ